MRNAQPHILAIDPGPAHSAWLLYDQERRVPLEMGTDGNGALLRALVHRDRWRRSPGTFLVVETVESFGMAVGREVFQTCIMIGRFIQSWAGQGGTWATIGRHKIKLHLCHAANARDSNIRAALIDIYGASRSEAVGTKDSPGPLYGCKNHIWSALAVARTAADLEIKAER